MNIILKKYKKLVISFSILFIIHLNILTLLACNNCDFFSDLHIEKIKHTCCKEEAAHQTKDKVSCKCIEIKSSDIKYSNNINNSGIDKFEHIKININHHFLPKTQINKNNSFLYTTLSKQSKIPIFIINCTFVI